MFQLRFGLQGPFGLAARRIPNRTGPTPDDDDRVVTRQLEAFQHHEGNQVPDVQGVARRVRPAVEADLLFFRQGP